MNKSEKVLSNKLGKKLNEAMIFSFEPSAIFLTKVLVLSSSLANFVRIVNITRSKNGCKWTSISFQLIEFVCFLRPRPISWKKKNGNRACVTCCYSLPKAIFESSPPFQFFYDLCVWTNYYCFCFCSFPPKPTSMYGWFTFICISSLTNLLAQANASI